MDSKVRRFEGIGGLSEGWSVGHPTSPVYPEDFLKSVRAVALLRIYRWSEITVEKIRELKDRIARREWRSDLPTVLPIRTNRLDIQKQVSEAKRMGTLPDLSAMLAAQLGLASEEGPSTTVPRTDEVPPSCARNAGNGKKRKRGGSGVEGSAEEASDVPPSGEPQKKKKKKKKKKKRTKKPVDEQSGNLEEPTEIEGGDVQEEELQPEEEASEAEISGERDNAAEVDEGEESEIPLNAARPDGSEEDSEESLLLIRRREWRSDLPTVLPIRTKRLDIFPKDIQKQVSEAKRMGTLPYLSAMLAAQLGLVSEEGPSTTVLRTGEVPPSCARNAGKGKKRKRGGSGVEGSAEEASDVPPSGEPQKKKKKKKKKRIKKPVDEQLENPEEPTEIEEGDVQEEELQPEEEASEAETSGERDDAAVVGEGEESEIPLNAARPDGSEEDSGESPLLIRKRNDEIGTSSRGSAILRRVPGVNFPDKVSFHYEGPAPRVYVPEKCGEFLRQLRGRAKPLPAVKDLIFGGEYEEAARAKLLGDSATNVVIDKYDTALKGALGELELAKKEHAEKEESSARQLNASRADVERLNGMVARIIARRDELKAELEIVLRSDEVHVSPAARESRVRALELSVLNDRDSDREA
ncbi:hypothetical protein F2Q69_00009176 [Brassica cretica]|uniref:Uncharacterized protein n=1 Tax=Brassica cretica TaxID=69181 RepID=A0A8S9NU03_BRACR|nr:hypothetical protein F2Q69_00009176 [Brassica cretica]